MREVAMFRARTSLACEFLARVYMHTHTWTWDLAKVASASCCIYRPTVVDYSYDRIIPISRGRVDPNPAVFIFRIMHASTFPMVASDKNSTAIGFSRTSKYG